MLRMTQRKYIDKGNRRFREENASCDGGPGGGSTDGESGQEASENDHTNDDNPEKDSTDEDSIDENSTNVCVLMF